MRVITLVLTVFAASGAAHGAKILVVDPIPIMSHNYVMGKLALDLAARGHQVTFITAFPQKNPVRNLEEIIFPNYYKKLTKNSLEKINDKSIRSLDEFLKVTNSFFLVPRVGRNLGNVFFSEETIQKFLQSDRRYDVVIVEAFCTEAIMAGFANKYNASLVAVATGPSSFFTNFLVGNVSPSSFIPSLLNPYGEKMSFMDRVITFCKEIAMYVYMLAVHLPNQDALMRKHFGNNLPYVTTIVKNTSLVLVNSHHSLAFPRPNVPNMVEIGGFHVKPIQPLPKEIKEYMDGAKHGVVLFSLGSHITNRVNFTEFVQYILRVFSRLKQNVIFKFKGDAQLDVPKNMKIVPWLPQSDILAHPNLKLFLTHCGMLSVIEAVHRGVPMLGLPFYFDQNWNAKMIERNGYGKSVSLMGELTEQRLYDTIKEILQNPEYRNNVRRGSTILQDVPVPPSVMATYWIEYVIRHKGAPHIRSGSRELHFYQLYLFDVFTFMATVLVLLLWIWYKMVGFAWKKLCRVKTTVMSPAKKKN